MALQNLTFYKGIILNPLNDSKCEFFPDGLMVVKTKNGKGVIHDLLSFSEGETKYKDQIKKKNFRDFGGHLIVPGFYDMHFHWVQDDVREMPKDSLLEWLDKYTFPTEMKYAKKKYSKKKAKSFFKKILTTGTIGGACYSSIHEHAVDAAMKEARGDFLIGNVLMNMNSPKELTQKEKDSLKISERLIKKYKERYVFTPRFAISTSPQVMKKGSALADKAGCFKQSHLAETPAEIEFVLSLYRGLPGFEKVKSYTEIYQKTGMLGKKSLMGHGIHLSSAELKTLSKTKTCIIHCPTSNAPISQKGLGSGLFDFKKIEKNNIRWALGSDIGGGPFLSMLDVIQSFVEQNKKKGVKGASYIKGLYRSTLAGAEIMGLSKQTGNFKKGKEANFVVFPLKGKVKNPEEALQKLISPLRQKRSDYDNLPRFVCLRGEAVKK
jgi:guanine deaminase